MYSYQFLTPTAGGSMQILQLLTAIRVSSGMRATFAAAALIAISALMQGCEPLITDEPKCCCKTQMGNTRINKDECWKKYGVCIDDKFCDSSSLHVIDPS